MINVNGIFYRKPKKPTVVICIDGGDPRYIDEAIKAGIAPTFKRFKEKGFYKIASSVIPSYTNPNNVAIITGVPPKINGIPGNWMYDKKSKKEKSLNSPQNIKCKTILEVFAEQGVKVASITTKDKLRLLLGKGWEGINISAELAHRISKKYSSINKIIKETVSLSKKNIISKPEKWMYSGKSSYYTLKLAVALMESKGHYKPDMIYVSLTDYIPHKEKPSSRKANQFFQKIDNYIKILDELGCIIGITADHGMNDKHYPDGNPKVIWINEELNKAGIKDYKTVLPVIDKYVNHHGLLGGAAWIYSKNIKKTIQVLSKVEGIKEMIRKEDAVKKYDLPEELIGDIIILGDEKTVFGTLKKEHKHIPFFLRSHGGLNEQKVPFLLNRPLNKQYAEKSKRNIRNFQIFDYILNRV